MSYFKKSLWFLAGCVFAISLTSAAVVLGQEGILSATAQPIVVNIDQSVPVEAVVEIPSDGEVITATVPMTVDVALQISINGDDVKSVQTISPTIPVQVTIPEVDVAQTDDLGIEYIVVLSEEDALDVAVTEWTAFASQGDYFAVSGEITALERSTEFENVVVTVRFFDRNDELIDVVDTTAASYIDPNQADRFDINTSVDVDDIKRYEVEIEIQR